MSDDNAESSGELEQEDDRIVVVQALLLSIRVSLIRIVIFKRKREWLYRQFVDVILVEKVAEGGVWA